MYTVVVHFIVYLKTRSETAQLLYLHCLYHKACSVLVPREQSQLVLCCAIIISSYNFSDSLGWSPMFVQMDYLNRQFSEITLCMLVNILTIFSA